MTALFQKLIVRILNWLTAPKRRAWRSEPRTNLGFEVIDGEVTKRRIGLGDVRRTTGLGVLGKTGSGKSSLFRHLAGQDVEADRGFAFFDIHGDVTPFLLGKINERERRERRHLSDRVVLIQPSDPIVSVGLNPLEQESPDFVRIAEVCEVLRWRWGLDHFGARTDELLRNSLYALSANGLTLVELSLFLTNTSYRAICLKKVGNAEVRQYFELRYDQVSEGQRATMREPILNKTSAFTSDPRFRHVVGQEHSTVNIREALDEAFWVLIDLDKGKLGPQALTLGSLVFTALKNALFTREKQGLFTLYCDEIQNLVSYGNGIETILSEARKFNTPIVSGNQFRDQLPPELRSALDAVGTHAWFQLSPTDAAQVSHMLDGGKTLTERLKNLPQRHAIVKSGAERWVEIVVPTVHKPLVDYTDLFTRVRYGRGRVRAHIDRDIAKRQERYLKTDDVLANWD